MVKDQFKFKEWNSFTRTYDDVLWTRCLCPGVGGVRIEDDVVIIDGVGVPLNKTTKDYIILEDK